MKYSFLKWLALSIIAFTSLSSCVKKPAKSEGKQVGHQRFPAFYSCKMLKYDFDKFLPLYLSEREKFGTSCNVAQESVAAGADLRIGRTTIPEMINTANVELVKECATSWDYLKNIRTHIEIMQKNWSDRSCDEGAAAAERMDIIDYPTCRVGCINGSDKGCMTCQHKAGDAKGFLMGDPNGHITCSAEADGRRAVKEWCKFVGTDKSCEDPDISCAKADVAELYDTVNAIRHETTHRYEASANILTYVKVGDSIPGVGTAEGRAGIRVGGNLVFDIAVNGYNSYPWVRRNGIEEGNTEAGYVCKITQSSFTAVSADGRIEVSLMFTVGAGSQIEADARRVNLTIAESEMISAAGLTRTQISGRCLVFATAFLKAQIENTGEVRAISEFLGGETDAAYKLEPNNLYCQFPDNRPNAGNRIATVHIDLGKNSTRVVYEYALDFWWDANSPSYEVQNSDIAPYKTDLAEGRVKGARLVQFMNEVVKPYSQNSPSWKILQCFNN